MKIKNYLLSAYAAVMALTLMPGCTADSPFDTAGEGTLRLRMVVNSEVTRASADQQMLADSCVIYISDSKGLLYKYKGLDQLPPQLPLRTGQYVAEAWTGDSVPASFDKKFYRGYQPFDITRDNVSSVILNCRIANVVASVNPAENVADKIQNYTVTISNSAGTLDFNADNVATAHGYYMMPDGDNTLTWVIAGENADGQKFTKSGKIENVKPAHEYILNLKYNPDVSGDDTGGGFITVTINDVELLVEDEITLYSAPVIKGEGFDPLSTFATTPGSFSDMTFRIYAFDAFQSIQLSTASATEMGLPASSFDITNLSTEAETALNTAGISWQLTRKEELDQTHAFITLHGNLFNRLGNGEYAITFRAVDSSGRARVLTWNLSISDAAVEAYQADPSSVRSYSATIKGALLKEGYSNPGIQYRAQGETNWNVAGASSAPQPGQEFTVALTGLKSATTYEYRAVTDGYINPKVFTFTTDPVFVLPNASFEQWSTGSNKAVIPSSSGKVEFWDTGNHGSITLNKNITNPDNTLFHSGATSAKLSSQFVGLGLIGKFAAGNIFTGTFDGTDGTNGILTFGRPFDGSHPIKLRGWINYRPATVSYSEGGLEKGDMDQGHIYIALTTKTYKVETKNTSDHPRVLFDPNDSGVLAYGELVITDNYGADGEMREFEITITPRAGYFAQKPAYIVLVASSSRYGDYFTGGTSTMYIDDLELVYE